MWTKEQEQILKDNYGVIHTNEIAEILSMRASNVRHKAYRMGLTSSFPNRKPSKKTIDRLESSIHKALEPIIKVSEKILFQCGHCDSSFYTTPSKIASGHTKSCGCTRVGKRTGGKYLSGTWLDRTKSSAIARGYDFDLTIEQLDSILEKQEFCCFLSGRNLIYGYVDLLEYTASLDRVDSSLGYNINNVQFLHKDVNMAKQSLTQENFINLCKDVVNANKFTLSNK